MYRRPWQAYQPFNILQQIQLKIHIQIRIFIKLQNSIIIIIKKQIQNMILIVLSVFLITQAASFTLTSPFSEEIAQLQAEQSLNLLGEIRYNGKGFGADLQIILEEAINDAAIFYKADNYSQANYIWNKLNGAKQGDWKVVLVINLTISKVTEISTGFYYWTQDDTWALWYSTSSFAKQTLHLVIYNGNEQKSISNVTTSGYKPGTGVPDQTVKAVDSIIQNLDSAQDIGKYTQKFDGGKKWSVLTIPFDWAGKCPEAWSALSVSDYYISYNKNVTILGKSSSMIMFV